MTQRKFGPRSRRAHPPKPDGSVAAESLGLAGVTALTRRTHRVIHNQTTVLVDYVEALYDPEQALLPPEIGPGARTLFTVKHKLHARRRWGRPQELTLYGPLFEVPGADGSKIHLAPIPNCFDSETGLDEELAAEFVADLPHFGIDALSRRSFVGDEKIRAIAEAHAAAQAEAVQQGQFRPICLAIDTVFLAKKIADKRKALHVTAADPLGGLYCSLALIPFVGNKQEPVIARLTEILKALPHPEALLATATDDGPERPMVAKALEGAQAVHPTLNPTPVLDPFHLIGNFVKVLRQRRVAIYKKWEKDRSKKRREARPLLKSLAKTIEKVRWSRIELDDETKKKMQYIFELSPELEEAYFIVDGLRRVFDCRSPEMADRAYAAWRLELAKAKKKSFETKAKDLDDQWDEVRRIFEVFARSDVLHEHLVSFGTNPVESLNKRAKEVWGSARNSSIELIELRLIAGQGYIAKSLVVSAPTRVRRQRKNPEKHPRQLRAERKKKKRLGSDAAAA